MRKLMACIIAFCVSCVMASVAQAQKPVQLLQKALETAKSHRYISYNVIAVNKNFFSDKDTSISHRNEFIITDSSGKVTKQNMMSSDNKGRPVFREVLVNDTLYNINLKDSIYSVVAYPSKATNTINNYIETLKYVIDKKASKINRQKDTLINNIQCYSFQVKSYDTVENNSHNYTHLYFYINKKSLLPVYTKEKGEGSANKGVYSLGRVMMFNEIHFNNYRFENIKGNSIFRVNLNGFDPENKVMLAAGTIAPEIVVNDLEGKRIPPDFFKNKILLLAFGSTTCGANPLANPALNRLMQKFNTADTKVISIYTDETAKQAKDYIESNHLEFPVYLGNNKLKKRFKTISTPNFYVIDGKGRVLKSFEGYYDKLEQEIYAALKQAQAEKQL